MAIQNLSDDSLLTPVRKHSSASLCGHSPWKPTKADWRYGQRVRRTAARGNCSPSSANRPDYLEMKFRPVPPLRWFRCRCALADRAGQRRRASAGHREHPLSRATSTLSSSRTRSFPAPMRKIEQIAVSTADRERLERLVRPTTRPVKFNYIDCFIAGSAI